MGTLTLVRHGQARPFDQDSDRLSELGAAQARALAAYWLQRDVAFDEACCGTLIRQCRTAEIVGECYAAAGRHWPALHVTADLNEYDAGGVIERLAPVLAESDAEFRRLAEEFQTNRHGAERNRYFQKMFEVLITRWQSGELAAPGVESWVEFQGRVRHALQRIVATEGGGRRVVAFTSGGVIGTALQTALAAPDARAMEIHERVRNCSLTEFVFGRGRLSLDSFNAVPHLDEPALVTFR